MPTYSTDANTLLGLSKCYLDNVMGEEQRAAIKIFARANNLKALGGTDYTTSINKLMTDAATWRTLACNQRDAINTYEAVADANVDGAGISTDPNALSIAATCYLNLGKEDKKNVLAFLSASIKTLVKPD